MMRTTLDFDLRLLAVGDVYRSWAVPKGTVYFDPAVRRLVIAVEDHDLASGVFEGVDRDARRGAGR